MTKITVKVDDTPVFLDQDIVREAVRKLERTSEFDSLRELLDFLLSTWVKE